MNREIMEYVISYLYNDNLYVVKRNDFDDVLETLLMMQSTGVYTLIAIHTTEHFPKEYGHGTPA